MDDSKHKPLPDFIKLKNESGTSEDVYYSAFCDYLPSEFQTIAEKELNETEENKTKGIKELRQFLKKENIPDVGDYSLIMVLRSCKYNIKKSETKLKKYMKARRLILEKLADLDPKTAEMIFEGTCIGILPYRDKQGRIIFFNNANKLNQNLYSSDDVLLVSVAYFLILLRYPMTTVAGVVQMCECKCASKSLYLSLVKSTQKYMWTLLDFPVRIGRIEVVNEHFLTRWFYNIVSPFLSSKLLGRIFFHGPNIENLRKMYPPDILPQEFSGNMDPLDLAFYKDIAVNDMKKLIAESRALKKGH